MESQSFRSQDEVRRRNEEQMHEATTDPIFRAQIRQEIGHEPTDDELMYHYAKKKAKEYAEKHDGKLQESHS